MSTIIVDTLTGKSTATTITIGSTPVVEIYHVNASDAATDANLSMGSIHGDLA